MFYFWANAKNIIISLVSEVEYKKLWQLYNRKMLKQIKTKIPPEEQRTVRIAVIGTDSNLLSNATENCQFLRARIQLTAKCH